MDFNENLRNNIQRLRKERNVTQDILAAALDISVQAVSKWENGASMPDIMQLPRIAKFFGVTIDYLFYNEGSNQNCINKDLPNDDTLRIIQFLGNKMLSENTWQKNNSIELKIPDTISTGISNKTFNVEIWGSANISGNVGGYVECAGNLNCSDIGGYAECGGSLNCANIGGYAECGGRLTCCNIGSYAECGSNLVCSNVGGYVECNSIEACGDIGGYVECGGNLRCKEIQGDVNCEGNITYEK